MDETARTLLEALVKLARELPPPLIETLAAALESLRDPLKEEGALQILGCTSRPTPREALQDLLAAWRSAPTPPAAGGVALALRAAAAMDSWHRGSHSVEFVWTGPTPHGTTLRRTDQALLELIRASRRRLVIVTFAAYQVAEIRQALVDAADRGVELCFIVESPEESQGKVDFDPMMAMGRDLAQRCSVWIWPLEERARDQRGRHGTLHAKCAIADGERLLVSSANLTGDAMQLNMELGVLIEGGDMPAVVAAHFDALMTSGTLSRSSGTSG